MSLPIEEVWRPVVGYEDRYEVSDHGRVRTVPRPGRPSVVRKPYLTSSGYLAVPLWRGSVGKNRVVHRLVAEAFCERGEGQPLVRHLDDNKLNNVPSNLAWGTYVENGLDAVRNGRNPEANKTHCVNGHEFSPDNTMRRANGRRDCRACTYERNRIVRERKRGEVGGCTVAGCDGAYLARGMCNRHYLAARKASRTVA